MAEQTAAQQQIAALESQIAQMQGGGQGGGKQITSPPGGMRMEGLLGGPQGASQMWSQVSHMPTEQIQQIYGLLAAGGDDPAAVGNQYVRAMQNNAQLSQYGGKPSNIREWEYYSSLSDADKKMYLEMKRGISLEDLGGDRMRLFSGGGTDQYGAADPRGDVYSTSREEEDAARRKRSAEGLGTGMAARYKILGEGQSQRQESYSEARRLRMILGADELNVGQYKQVLHLVWRNEDMEALDALAERTARARVKANGEIRPTDADVEGEKKALFGAGRTEEFTGASLDRLIAEIERQEYEYNELGQYMIAPLHGNQPTDIPTPAGLGGGGDDRPLADRPAQTEAELNEKYGLN
jgi:hypothetical protein